MRFAYADPPYLGQGQRLYGKHALGYIPGDEIVDLYPGTGVMGRVAAARDGIASPGELDLFGDEAAS